MEIPKKLFVKLPCLACEETGVIETVGVEDPLGHYLSGKNRDPKIKTVEEPCPVCDGKGWVWHKEEG